MSRVAYYYDSEVGNYYYGMGHPMKPHRIRMTHDLIVAFELYKKMEVYKPYRLSQSDMAQFHTDDYLNFLRNATPENSDCATFKTDQDRYNMDLDCPIFDGIFEFCQISGGGSVGGAYKLNNQTSDICINWAGGLHHAKKAEASGFCYVNDIVLGILELLRFHDRVLYIDIDIHHGDGVEEAFYTTDRVMTVSFHKYGKYFPGTGDIDDIGYGNGKNYALNFPLKDGLDDDSFRQIFKDVISKVMDSYRPGCIVLQCGADSLTGDRLGSFNLTLKGHGYPLQYLKQMKVPLLVLGGGGYTIRNVARAWAYETSLCIDTELPDDLPYNDYFEYYGPDFKLHLTPSNQVNMNTKYELEKTTNKLLEMLRPINRPSVEFHDRDRTLNLGAELDIEGKTKDNQDPDKRPESKPEKPNEF